MLEQEQHTTHEAPWGMVPPEVITPICISVIIFLSLSAYSVYRFCRCRKTRNSRLTSSPTWLAHINRDLNRRWSANLSSVKDLCSNTVTEKDPLHELEIQNPQTIDKHHSTFVSKSPDTSLNRPWCPSFFPPNDSVNSTSQSPTTNTPRVEISVKGDKNLLSLRFDTIEHDMKLVVQTMLDERIGFHPNPMHRPITDLASQSSGAIQTPSYPSRRYLKIANTPHSLKPASDTQKTSTRILYPIKEVRESWHSNDLTKPDASEDKWLNSAEMSLIPGISNKTTSKGNHSKTTLPTTPSLYVASKGHGKVFSEISSLEVELPISSSTPNLSTRTELATSLYQSRSCHAVLSDKTIKTTRARRETSFTSTPLSSVPQLSLISCASLSETIPSEYTRSDCVSSVSSGQNPTPLVPFTYLATIHGADNGSTSGTSGSNHSLGLNRAIIDTFPLSRSLARVDLWVKDDSDWIYPPESDYDGLMD
ncbi:hypothetical protein PNOK_0645300 [Pyrrhoderma noxium]|uniref:Uncharacterized protein n=1 Tax=Pyrrhoderma noxium TaxID=2282107 RepID=A0A286UEG5_9AGAM|nr:hypothetical protein PNOK_0645300 [Pyrrhoderma noxium]